MHYCLLICKLLSGSHVIIKHGFLMSVFNGFSVKVQAASKQLKNPGKNWIIKDRGMMA